MKKRIAGIMAVFAVIGILGGCQKAAGQDHVKSNLVIRLAHQPGHTQPLIARDQGFFEEEFSLKTDMEHIWHILDESFDPLVVPAESL